ncbi:MAG: metallophosphoesterase family protein [Candidatus Izemoplasmataceae bacterium]
MRFIHFSDLHIGYKFQNASFKAPHLFSKRSMELLKTFYDCLDIAKTNAYDFILLTGDLFDHAFVSPKLIDDVFQALNDTAIPTFVTVGNHDIFLQNQAYQRINEFSHIHFFSKTHPIYTLGDIEIAGINTKDFSPEFLEDVTSKLSPNKTHVLSLHGDVYNKQDDYYLVSPKVLETYPYDYIALGHIHKHDFLRPHIAYSGNLEPFDFSETGDKGYISGDLATHTFTFKKMNKRAYHVKTLQLSVEDALTSIKEKIMQAFTDHEKRQDFNRLKLTGRLNRHYTLDETFIDTVKQEFYYLEIVNDTLKDYDLIQLKKAYKDTIIELIIEEFDDHEDDLDALYLALDELLKTEEGYF